MNKSQRHVLVVDDEESMRHMIRLVLSRDGYTVTEATNGRQGIDRLQSGQYPLILCDIRMPDMDGLDFLKEKMKFHLKGTVIMMSAYGTLDTAVECMKQGAYDYIAKPFRPDEVLLAVRKAEERLQLRQENVRLKKNIERSERPQGMAAIVYESTLMSQVVDTLNKVAAAPVSVLITGETGTGKELIARAIHAESARQDGPFLAVNCSAIPPGLIESELFGHVRGAYTGADRDRTGMFGAAEGGTLLLDEISDLPLDLQPKLLRVLQEQEIRRVGESRSRKIDVRVLAATAVDLQQAVQSSRFREDLFYRLAVVTISLPALRDRREDIRRLIDCYLPVLALRHKRPTPKLSEQAISALEQHDWPGNVRELINTLEKTLVLCRDDLIDESALAFIDARPAPMPNPADLSLKKAIPALERDYIAKALSLTEGNKTQAAKILEISLRSLIYKIKDYQL
ncbi:MAG: sigma-54-dependent Fis family transcriptional regulator [Deltaproteobacteria bacterium]|jgi:two-component system response regulator AtoC|nr:sigma-54-dependent Fis family transcriptional regulator [Deltaproteobacteria bacterium]